MLEALGMRQNQLASMIMPSTVLTKPCTPNGCRYATLWHCDKLARLHLPVRTSFTRSIAMQPVFHVLFFPSVL